MSLDFYHSSANWSAYPAPQPDLLLRIEPFLPSDWPTARIIYEEGIATGNSTFETVAPTWEAWDKGHRADCRLAARRAGQLVGWAALSSISSRCVYGGVAEVSVYIGEAARGRGIGRVLLNALVAASEEAGIWTLQSGIFPENLASLRIHHDCGFQTVGRRHRIGRLHGIWRDILLLERRSRRVGIDNE